MNKVDAYDREAIMAEQAKILMDKLGGSVILDGTDCKRYNFVATLPTVDDNTRFFEVGNQDPSIIQVRHIGEIYLYSTNYLSFLTLENDTLYIEFGKKSICCGWNVLDAKKGLVYGFTDKPKVIDRGYRICMSSGFAAVQIPFNNLENHRAIRIRKS